MNIFLPDFEAQTLQPFVELMTSGNTQAWTLLFCKQNLGSLGSRHSPRGSVASLDLGMVFLGRAFVGNNWSLSFLLPKTRKLVGQGVTVWEGAPSGYQLLALW